MPTDTDTVDKIFLQTDWKNKAMSHVAIEYRAFQFACESGTYRFFSNNTDDITLIWFGKNALSGGTRANVDLQQTFRGDNSGVKIVTHAIEAGTNYPFRILWGNYGGGGDLSLKIFAPDGREVLPTKEGVPRSAGQAFITTEACDGSQAPFPSHE